MNTIFCFTFRHLNKNLTYPQPSTLEKYAPPCKPVGFAKHTSANGKLLFVSYFVNYSLKLN